MARPTKLDSQLAGRLCHIIRGGNYAETAAAFVGIVKQTYRNWLLQGARAADFGGDLDAARDTPEYLLWDENVEQWKAFQNWTPGQKDAKGDELPQPPRPDTLRPESDAAHVAFLDAVEKAKAEGEVRDMLQIGQHGQESWQALAWRRERMNPQRFGRSYTRVDVSQDGGAQVSAPAEALVVFHLPSNGREKDRGAREAPWTGKAEPSRNGDRQRAPTRARKRGRR